MPNLSKDQIDLHAARVAASVFKAVEERHELLPYMRRLLVRSVVQNLQTLTDEEISAYVDQHIRDFDAKTKKEG